MPDLLAGFEAFAPNLMIPSRDAGLIPFWPLYGTQEHILREMRAGLEEDIHDFVILKGGRQIGGSTLLDGITLYYLQTYPGLTGMMVSDDDFNRDYRRDVMIQMHQSLPNSHKWPTRLNNRFMLVWAPPNNSRLVFDAAGKRTGSNLGRSKGINFNYNDENGSWGDPQAYSSLRASRSKVHPLRLFVDISTARGIGSVWQKVCETARHSVTQRFIFAAWWRHRGCRSERGSKIFETYGHAAATPSERLWIRAVRKEYGVSIEPEQLAFYRWMGAEEFRDDETMLAQEFGCLPEDCFQAFGDKFVPPYTIQRLRAMVKSYPSPKGYRYEWGPYLDNTTVEDARVKDAPLVIYEEPDPNAVYVVAAHPWGSSSPQARAHVCQVWRAWPDKLRLVAEFYDEAESMYHFAWACLHLTAAYKTWSPVYFILEIGMSGAHVLTEIDRISNLSYGLSPDAKANNVTAFIESIQYLYRRADSFGASVLRQVKSTAEIRARLLYGLRDEVEREHVEIGNPALIDELASLRRGEAGDSDEIEGGGDAPEARAITAGMAVLAWLEQAMPDLLAYIPPKEETGGPRHVGEAVVQAMLSRVMRRA